MCDLFDALVSSTLNYSGGVLGFGKSKEIECIYL